MVAVGASWRVQPGREQQKVSSFPELKSICEDLASAFVWPLAFLPLPRLHSEDGAADPQKFADFGFCLGRLGWRAWLVVALGSLFSNLLYILYRMCGRVQGLDQEKCEKVNDNLVLCNERHCEMHHKIPTYLPHFADLVL